MTTNAWDEKWSEWFTWHGAEKCPIDSDCTVEFVTKGMGGGGTNNPKDLMWVQAGTEADIIAYRYKIKEPESESMKRGKTEAETLALNGWKVGDILEGDEGNGPDRILITAIGEDRFTCKWDYKCTGEYHRESGNTTLSCREWRKVGYRAGLGQTEVTPDEEEAWQAKERQLIGGPRTAENFLHQAAELMAERGKQYDQPGGERSMGKAVAALNAITGRDLTEAEGWLLMSLVKRVRQHSGAGYHQDSAEDAVAYAALEAEALESSALRARELVE